MHLDALCEKMDIHPFTGRLLLYICMPDDMRAHYVARGIDLAFTIAASATSPTSCGNVAACTAGTARPRPYGFWAFSSASASRSADCNLN